MIEQKSNKIFRIVSTIRNGKKRNSNENNEIKSDIIKGEKNTQGGNQRNIMENLTRDRGGIDISYVLAHFPIGYKCITFGQE